MKYQLIIPFGTEIFHKRGPMCIWDSNKVTAVFESSFIDDTASFQFTHKGNALFHGLLPTRNLLQSRLQTSPFGCPASHAALGGCQ